ncbi:hypothetical protein G6F46_014525 [Rhizopus delemar]|nr:hypothetical protein G6F46_014525 [Rhizopus delemar]
MPLLIAVMHAQQALAMVPLTLANWYVQHGHFQRVAIESPGSFAPSGAILIVLMMASRASPINSLSPARAGNSLNSTAGSAGSPGACRRAMPGASADSFRQATPRPAEMASCKPATPEATCATA